MALIYNVLTVIDGVTLYQDSVDEDMPKDQRPPQGGASVDSAAYLDHPIARKYIYMVTQNVPGVHGMGSENLDLTVFRLDEIRWYQTGLDTSTDIDLVKWKKYGGPDLFDREPERNTGADGHPLYWTATISNQAVYGQREAYYWYFRLNYTDYHNRQIIKFWYWEPGVTVQSRNSPPPAR